MNIIEIEIDDKLVRQALDELAGRVKERGPALAAIGRKIKTLVQQCFQSGRDPWDNLWAPLKNRTGQPLRKSGRLQRSIDYVVQADDVVIGTNVEYAAVHQFGHTFDRAARSQRSAWDKRGRFAKARKAAFGSWVTLGAHKQTVPARPFLPLPDLPPAWWDAVNEIVARHLDGAPA